MTAKIFKKRFVIIKHRFRLGIGKQQQQNCIFDILPLLTHFKRLPVAAERLEDVFIKGMVYVEFDNGIIQQMDRIKEIRFGVTDKLNGIWLPADLLFLLFFFPHVILRIPQCRRCQGIYPFFLFRSSQFFSLLTVGKNRTRLRHGFFRLAEVTRPSALFGPVHIPRFLHHSACSLNNIPNGSADLIPQICGRLCTTLDIPDLEISVQFRRKGYLTSPPPILVI